VTSYLFQQGVSPSGAYTGAKDASIILLPGLRPDNLSHYNYGGSTTASFVYDGSGKFVVETRFIFGFDISSIPITEVVTSAILRLETSAAPTETGTPTRTLLVARLTPVGAGVGTTDWTEGTHATGLNDGTGASWADYGGAATGGATITALGASGLDTLVTTGTAHGLVTNNTVYIVGAPAYANGKWNVKAAPTTTTFTIDVTTGAGAAAGSATKQTTIWTTPGGDWTTTDQYTLTGPAAALGANATFDIGSSAEFVAQANNALHNQGGRFSGIIRTSETGTKVYNVTIKSTETATAAQGPELLIETRKRRIFVM